MIVRSVSVKGQTGCIRVGYQQAATLGRYSLTPTGPNEWQVEASVMSADAFWMTQSPRTLELHVGAQRWRWPAAGLVVDGGIVRGTVTGRPERR